MKTKKMRLIISIVSLIIIGALTLILPGCTEADRVNHNLSKQANYFDCERRITVYNARTDKVILYIEGYIDISNNTTNELVCNLQKYVSGDDVGGDCFYVEDDKALEAIKKMFALEEDNS